MSLSSKDASSPLLVVKRGVRAHHVSTMTWYGEGGQERAFTMGDLKVTRYAQNRLQVAEGRRAKGIPEQ